MSSITLEERRAEMMATIFLSATNAGPDVPSHVSNYAIMP